MFDPLKTKMKVLFYVALAFLVGVGVASGMGWTRDAAATPAISVAPQIPAETVQPARDLSESFVRVAEMVTPAVVSITTRRVVRSTANDPFRNWFGTPDPEPRGGSGSGFLVSSDGYILTNNHVVEDTDAITVQLEDRRAFEATLIGGDPTTDVAVIKVEGSDLPTLSLGDSDGVRVGEWVLAVGNPGVGPAGGTTSFNHTVTAGIVSFKGRPLGIIGNELRSDPESQEAAQYAIEDFIQTDAVINPGNSGGPMVNLDGQVIGINSAIASGDGYYQGYGFAIPISLARRVMEDLIEYREVRRAFLGVGIGAVPPEAAEVYGLPEVSGALVQEVNPGTPAEEAGLELEDVIVAIDDDPVSHSNQLQQLIARKRPGDRVRIAYYRDGERRATEARLGESPLNEATVVAAAPERTTRAEERLGIEVVDNSPQLARRYQFRTDEGVLISSVTRSGPADMQGVRAGELIVAVNRQRVDSADEVTEILAGVETGEIVTLLLANPVTGRQRFNYIRMPR